MRFWKRLLACAALLAFLAAPALAGDQWTDPEREGFQAPPSYAAMGRTEYARKHWVDFYLNDGAQDFHLFSGYCDVFCTPGDLGQGYTAIDDFDREYAFPAFGAAMILASLGVPYEPINSTDGYWLVSPAFWREYTLRHPEILQWNAFFIAGGEQILDVPIGSSYTGFPDGSAPKPLSETVNNPLCVYNCTSNGEAPGFKAAGWEGTPGAPGSRVRYWWSTSPVSPVKVRKEAAATLAYNSYTSRAVIKYQFTRDIAVTELKPLGDPAGGKQSWEATVVNYTPFVALGVRLRAYVATAAGKSLAAETSTDIGPAPVLDWRTGGVKRPETTWWDGPGVVRTDRNNVIKWRFTVDVPASGDYSVTASANLDFSGVRGKPEPLSLKTAYGDATRFDGIDKPYHETKALFRPPGNLLDSIEGGVEGYLDNWLTVDVKGNQVQSPLPDYEAVYVKVFDPSGNEVPDGGEVDPDRSYRIVARFVQKNPKFTQGQYVRTAIGMEDNGTNVLKYDDATWFAGPGQHVDLVVDSYRFGGPPRTVTLFGSVNGDRRVEESDYGNNRAYVSLRVRGLKEGNLSVTGLSTGATASGGYDTAEPGKSYTATATFKSTFPVAGSAWVRLYWKTEDPAGPVTLIKEEKRSFSPGGEVQLSATWTMPQNARSGVLYATVAEKWDGSKWVTEPFEGADGKRYTEQDYTDNVAYRSVSVRVQPSQTRKEQKYLRVITRQEQVQVTRTVWYQDGVWVVNTTDQPGRVQTEVFLVK
ncbi:hypothetical protein Adeg_0787 [Ammonifex degensii KC4]|uniref:Uncharacterized protein n=1 Tax=Ammonifex degensii (strain DSM 10501 / KC4) TaxID=429009 RepID=C9RCF3_AMMDK|nr:hypothetical protein [Ammonifex degensii]ACX51930.1 hypothetical protein Adeg_0787 [Ammonifex degensii KC4]